MFKYWSEFILSGIEFQMTGKLKRTEFLVRFELTLNKWKNELLIRVSVSVCEKFFEIIWNAWKDVLFNALTVWKWGFMKTKKVCY